MPEFTELTDPAEAAGPPKPKTILMWGQEDILGEAVEHFLATRQDWRLIRVPPGRDAAHLSEQIRQARPEAVIVYQGSTADTALPAQLLRDCPEPKTIKIVVVSLENNALDVYCRQQVWVRDVPDLLSAIEG